MSPILVRPVREQFEHDRVIRVLQAKYKRKYEVTINPGAEQNASVGVGELPMYPDLVLFSQEKNRKVQGTIEVETAESVNTLEAMAEWAPFSKLRTPFFLYVPANSIDTVRRLCTEHSIDPAEIWTYHTALDQVRFTMVHRSPDAPKGSIAEFKPKPAPVVSLDEEPQAEAPPTKQAPAKPAPAKPAAVKVAAKKAAAKGAKAAKPTKIVKAKPRPAAKAAAKKSNGAPQSAKSAKPGRSAQVKSASSAKSKSAQSSKKSAKSNLRSR